MKQCKTCHKQLTVDNANRTRHGGLRCTCRMCDRALATARYHTLNPNAKYIKTHRFRTNPTPKQIMEFRQTRVKDAVYEDYRVDMCLLPTPHYFDIKSRAGFQPIADRTYDLIASDSERQPTDRSHTLNFSFSSFEISQEIKDFSVSFFITSFSFMACQCITSRPVVNPGRSYALPNTAKQLFHHIHKAKQTTGRYKPQGHIFSNCHFYPSLSCLQEAH